MFFFRVFFSHVFFRLCIFFLTFFFRSCLFFIMFFSEDDSPVRVKNVNPHVGVQQVRRVADIDGRLLLVASQHPHVDVCTQEGGDGFRHLATFLISC